MEPERFKHALDRYDESVNELTLAIEQVAILRTERDQLSEQVDFLMLELKASRRHAAELLKRIEKMQQQAKHKKSDYEARQNRYLQRKCDDLRRKYNEISEVLTNTCSELNAERARKQQLHCELLRLKKDVPTPSPGPSQLPNLIAGFKTETIP